MIQIIAGLIVVIVAGGDLIGQPARLVHIIWIVAGAFAAGVGTGIIAAKRQKNILIKINQTDILQIRKIIKCPK